MPWRGKISGMQQISLAWRIWTSGRRFTNQKEFVARFAKHRLDSLPDGVLRDNGLDSQVGPLALWAADGEYHATYVAPRPTTPDEDRILARCSLTLAKEAHADADAKTARKYLDQARQAFAKKGSACIFCRSNISNGGRARHPECRLAPCGRTDSQLQAHLDSFEARLADGCHLSKCTVPAVDKWTEQQVKKEQGLAACYRSWEMGVVDDAMQRPAKRARERDVRVVVRGGTQGVDAASTPVFTQSSIWVVKPGQNLVLQLDLQMSDDGIAGEEQVVGSEGKGDAEGPLQGNRVENEGDNDQLSGSPQDREGQSYTSGRKHMTQCVKHV